MHRERIDASGKELTEEDEHRQDRERAQGEEPVGVKKDRNDHRVDQRGVGDVEKTRPEEEPHLGQVVDHTAHHLPLRHAVVEVRALPEQVVKEVSAQSVLHLPTGIEDEDTGKHSSSRCT